MFVFDLIESRFGSGACYHIPRLVYGKCLPIGKSVKTQSVIAMSPDFLTVYVDLFNNGVISNVTIMYMQNLV